MIGFREMTNEEIKTGIRKLVASEHENLVSFLRYLIEVENRELFLEEGASSIQDFCERLLGLCHGTALKRIWVARAASRFPLILDFLAESKLQLTAVSLLVRHLTEENHRDLLTTAVGKTEPELKWWLSELFPEKLPPDWKLDGQEKIIPLDGKTAKFVLVVDEEFVKQLKRAKEIHKHEFPDGNSLAILKKALNHDLHDHDPRQKAKRARKPQCRDKKETPSRRIPRGIEYAARERAGHQCAYVSPNGVRCTERAGVELDHRVSWAVGGSSKDLRNIQLLCFAHNRWKGRLEFGKDYRRANPWRLQ